MFIIAPCPPKYATGSLYYSQYLMFDIVDLYKIDLRD